MPELPEVETVVRELQITSAGEKILKAQVFTHKIRVPVPENLDKTLKNRKILSVSRRAKYILIHLDNAHILVIHLGMSGRINIHEHQSGIEKKKHDHFLMQLSNGRDVVFNDPRRFGLIAYVAEADLDTDKLFAHLGPEPLSPAFTPKYLGSILKSRKGPVKIALMDQELVVGVGNIYAAEALFESGIHPETPARDVTEERLGLLIKAIKKVLKAAIAAGGSTLKDYRKTNGDLGYFQHKFAVYDRAGKECRGCTCNISKTGGVQRMVQGGRSTFYCPRKQI